MVSKGKRGSLEEGKSHGFAGKTWGLFLGSDSGI